MTLGRKSLKKVLLIANKQNPKKPFKVTIQANKNHGICDIYPRKGELLTIFQGRQYDDSLVIEHLENVLYELLND